MAHNIATINGRESMAYQGQTPWHKLGKRVASLTNIADALQAGNLNWRVDKAPMFLADGRKVPDRMAIIRDVDSAILGTVGEGFSTIQNADGLGILSDSCLEYGVTIESIGALGNGAKVWALAKMPESFEVTQGDSVKGYFLVTFAHDGTSALVGLPTPIRVVCQNTLSAALADGQTMIKIRHTASASARVVEARRLVTSMIGAMKQTHETFSALAARRMSAADVQKYVETVFPNPKPAEKPSTHLTNRREAVLSLVQNGVGADLAGARADGSTTVWGAYNAVTEYFDHVRPGKAGSESAALRANESAIFGQGADLKLFALQTARQLVAA